MTPQRREALAAEMARFRAVSVDCAQHSRPVHVVSFVSEDGRPWYELVSSTASARRSHAERIPNPDWLLDWIESTPPGDRPHTTTVQELGSSGELVQRDVVDIKCRWHGGGSRRAEKLDPVLELLHAAGRRTVTLREFWRVAHAWDNRHA